MKRFVVLAMSAVVFSTATSYAQQSPDKRPRIERKQDSRYLVYVSGIT